MSCSDVSKKVSLITARRNPENDLVVLVDILMESETYDRWRKTLRRSTQVMDKEKYAPMESFYLTFEVEKSSLRYGLEFTLDNGNGKKYGPHLGCNLWNDKAPRWNMFPIQGHAILEDLDSAFPQATLEGTLLTPGIMEFLVSITRKRAEKKND